ncbi:hypothetical protein [Rhodomicrobium lacus]|uniref:hypothetical protein n=1 Tax=Rhodomicrobium lacus TaxID=2498452 RepID=UPI000F8DAAC3|nr:hypothetical protein [Rhodomicrobium lacus]
MINDSFANRMDAQRAVLKEINRLIWPNEVLFALSEAAIQRWANANRLEPGDEVVKLARQAGEALLFLASSSQEQVSPEYASLSFNMTEILARLRLEVMSRRSN